MLRRLPLLALVLVSLIGCSSTDPEPAEPPDVKGQYTGTFDFDLLRSDGLGTPLSCGCEINIVWQSGDRFNGNATFVDGPCGSGTLPFSGTVEVDGTVELGFAFSLLGPDCIKSSAPPLTGTFSGGTISAQTTEEYNCTEEGFQYTLGIELTATRT